ncbi:LacI family DNA-binding transcriptional regulator [Muricoccus pecuniae]|uniref:LacI family gluconate utilization system Gnt-I transcriptional repressor n=1 Tax=Muricoccus pecuniae TaxID=693023 RepID=A0A840Y543_9PROT|nr:LacI family DNA-binding transcriptional regulator [Roseomonas pecuniae]MBB5696248.1 LacI family gluconate utilization system Gnt-I transcriptional repressor [Roseomonas pecuniae]
MAEVAALAGVSTMTVSRALRDPSTVTDGTMRRIRSAIDATGYVPNRIAGSLASRRSNIVGVIVPSLRNSLFAETIQGIADALGSAYDLMIANSGYSLPGEETAIRAFLAQRVCGIVLHNARHTRESTDLLREAGIPCIETGNLVSRPIDMTIGFSNREAARAMTAHLVARHYRRIGFVSLPVRENDRAAERRAGYLAALAEAGIEVDPSLVLESPPGLRGGAEALVTLMALSPRPEAAFLTGDVLAVGALLEANRRGWSVPGDIAIAGSDDNELHSQVSPPLTSLRFPRYEIGRLAGVMLLERLQGNTRAPAIVDLGFEIVERASV